MVISTVNLFIFIGNKVLKVFWCLVEVEILAEKISVYSR